MKNEQELQEVNEVDNKISEFLFDMDMACSDLERGITNLAMVQSTVEADLYGAQNAADALYFVEDGLRRIHNEMRSMIDDELKNRRTERERNHSIQ